MRISIFNSISVKLGTLLFVIFFLLVISIESILYLFFVNFYTQDVVRELTQRSDAYAEVLSEDFDEAILNYAGLIESTSSKMIMVVDHSDNIIASSEGITSLSQDYLEEVIHHGDEDHGPIIASDWKNEDYFVAQSFIQHDHQAGGKVIMFSSTHPVREAVTFLNRTFAVVGVITFIISALLIFIASNKVVQPLLKIIRVTKLISEGKYDWRLRAKGSDEIAELSYAVNQMSKDIQNYQQQRTKFFMDISHELRTPLTYFKGYVEAVLNGMVTTEEDKKKYLHLLYNQSGQLQRLVQDLSDLSQLENEEFTLQRTRTSIETVMVNSLEFMGPSIEEKGIELTYELSPTPLYVSGDEQRLQQVIINLLENAKKYTPASGTIKVSTYQDKDQCVIEVADTGPGIPKKDLPHIWERLYRVEKSRSRDTGGSGLGLTICQKIVALHTGEITVASEEGVGTTFQVRLPVWGS
ncbi:sensor histidine kinase [Halalkalibacter nanhaiisediminis]|uniref:histidine kinase n=1 Tax=Halalkalibacter nanhaiisediminis TaxID=688079 RepID=A0A562QCQ1_9BACI|nr:ATP-binding protein [Halalkalibacter nanhaiisediminis]TWI54493.1 signal transduction histidine kinase [Halalkalibacter nanhaiisediminis]